jgi:hypothetical protein
MTKQAREAAGDNPGEASSRIFISYRREDSGGQAGRISDRIKHEFGDSGLFIDVDGIPLGVDFVKRLIDEVASCDILLAVIGPGWLDIRNDKGERRLDGRSDYVRVEIRAALQRDIPVIPILLDDTKIPAPALLPVDIRALAFRSALSLRHASFHADLDRLIRDLKRASGQESSEEMRRRDEGLRDSSDVSSAKSAARTSAYDDFLDILKKFRGLSTIGLGTSVTVPFVAYMSGIQPPWPPGVVLVTALLELIALILVFQFLRNAPRRLVNRVIGFATAALLAFSTLYLSLFSFFTYAIPTSSTRSVKGFVCRSDLLKSYAEACPFLNTDYLRNAAYSAEAFWQSWSIDLMKLCLVLSWLAAFLALSVAVASFIVFQTKLRPRQVR